MNRRQFLLTTLIASLAACSWSGDDKTALPDWLKQLALDPAAAAALGEAYLADHPTERDARKLLNAIEQAMNDGETFAALDQAVRAEYARAECVQVNRFMLSRTEARLYALVGLVTKAV